MIQLVAAGRRTPLLISLDIAGCCWALITSGQWTSLDTAGHRWTLLDTGGHCWTFLDAAEQR